jgi:hypothetical protein
MRTWQIMLLSRLLWDRETANLTVIIRWGVGRKHQDITAQDSEITVVESGIKIKTRLLD